MEKRVAGFVVAPIWRDFMARAFQTLPRENFTAPTFPNTGKPVLQGEWRGGRTYQVDSISGHLATTATPPELVETRIIPEIHSILHWVDPKNPQGDIPENPLQNSQYTNWESAVRAWAEQKGLLEEEQKFSVPTDIDTIHTEENKPQITVQKPKEHESFSPDSMVTVTLEIKSAYSITQVDYFLDGAYVGSNKSLYETFAFTLPESVADKKTADITIKAYDEAGNAREKNVSIRIGS